MLHLPTGHRIRKTGEKGDLQLGRRICLSEVHYSGYGLAPRQFGNGGEIGLFKLEIEALSFPKIPSDPDSHRKTESSHL